MRFFLKAPLMEIKLGCVVLKSSFGCDNILFHFVIGNGMHDPISNIFMAKQETFMEIYNWKYLVFLSAILSK